MHCPAWVAAVNARTALRGATPAAFFRSPVRAPPSAVEFGEDLPGLVGQFRLAGGDGSGGGFSGGFRIAARFPLARQADEEVTAGGLRRDRQGLVEDRGGAVMVPQPRRLAGDGLAHVDHSQGDVGGVGMALPPGGEELEDPPIEEDRTGDVARVVEEACPAGEHIDEELCAAEERRLRVVEVGGDSLGLVEIGS